ncbi:endolytic transglycosylase MltG [Solitalea sp. MAHUQ-68]|uniref:Endolytic murein transglycosylase n=1 Tax=Solitalea agri TaxID=2953739 RepID=A0A9X2JDJ9_9SPHI|nr:endolytic transglycosylase MltG [Solitalea agri]MCO4294547.1 endolytic transglycosylase MltG [Solitalea agri]
MKKIILGVLAIILIGALSIGGYFYFKLLKPNTGDFEQKAYLYIPTGGTFKNVIDSLEKNHLLKNVESFKWSANFMKYNDSNIKAGRYRISKGISNRVLINMLKAGNQEAVRLTFNNIRIKSQFAGYVARKLEIDSVKFLTMLNDEQFVGKFGFTPETVFTVFIPNTYELFWNTNQQKFFSRMYDEYQKFWTSERKKKAEELGLSPEKVSVLASIVYWETKKTDEMPIVAGVYLNRLKKGMKLEADPTVIFAEGDFTISRVRGKMMSNPSPYNTYVHTGLPPGPISMPSVTAIDAVLNYQKHNYIYFCAKDDFSGRHAFAETMEQHIINAKKFQKALDARGIK